MLLEAGCSETSNNIHNNPPKRQQQTSTVLKNIFTSKSSLNLTCWFSLFAHTVHLGEFFSNSVDWRILKSHVHPVRGAAFTGSSPYGCQHFQYDSHRQLASLLRIRNSWATLQTTTVYCTVCGIHIILHLHHLAGWCEMLLRATSLHINNWNVNKYTHTGSLFCILKKVRKKSPLAIGTSASWNWKPA